MARLIVNCDLGEHESAEQTDQLMSLIDAANICCGVHAGSMSKTREALRLAKRYNVMVGAHPGLSAEGGRGLALPSADEFRVLLKEQLEAFFSFAGEAGVEVTYVKLHGSLYSAVEVDPVLLDVYLEVLQSYVCKPGLFALSGGRNASEARRRGIPVWEELFADRGYQQSGALVPRSEPGALLSGEEALQRFRAWKASGQMPVVGGSSVALSGQTLCVHSDSPDALALLSALRAEL